MYEIYTVRQAHEKAKAHEEKFTRLITTAINLRLQADYQSHSDIIDITDLVEFYEFDKRNLLWDRIMEMYAQANWDIYRLRVTEYDTYLGTKCHYVWKMSVANIMEIRPANGRITN